MFFIRRTKKVVKHLDWGQRWKELIPVEPAMDKVARDLSKIASKIVSESPQRERLIRGLQWSLCQHAFDRFGRNRGRNDREEMLCDYCDRFFKIEGVVVQKWLAERTK